MEKIIRLSTDHSSKHTEKTQVIDVKMSGGCPWFAYIWIDDVMYSVRKKDRGKVVTIKRFS